VGHKSEYEVPHQFKSYKKVLGRGGDSVAGVGSGEVMDIKLEFAIFSHTRKEKVYFPGRDDHQSVDLHFISKYHHAGYPETASQGPVSKSLI
jgi:hypothetical protein